MNLILVDTNSAVVDAWEEAFEGVDAVAVLHGSILDVACDAVVSPANTFGFMDGWIDRVYTQHFGNHVQQTLQDMIEELHCGEMPIGHALIVETEDLDIPYLISTPTMRLPGSLTRSADVYEAVKAALAEVKSGTLPNGSQASDEIEVIAFPGMGTGVGRLPAESCAFEMRRAILEFI